jgi:hypothetical protein
MEQAWMAEMNWTRIAGSVVFALLISLSTMNGVAGSGTSSGPHVVSGWKNGPVAIPTYPTIGLAASLPVPAGRYLVWAKLYVSNDNAEETSRLVTCRLGTNSGDGHAGTVAVGSGDTILPTTLPMALATTVTIGRTGGHITVWCFAQLGFGMGTTARWIKIAAVQLGKLTTIELPNGIQTSSGSGTPTAVVASRAGPVNLPLGVTKTLGQLTLSAGRWYVRSSFTLEEAAVGDFRCRLTLDGAIADVGDVESDGWTVVASVDGVVSSSSEFDVGMTCKGSEIDAAGSGSYGNPTVLNVRVAALKLGTLVTFDRRGTAQSSGSGTPRLQFKTLPGKSLPAGWTTLGSMDVASGRWLFLSNSHSSSAVLNCQLRPLPDYDQTYLGSGGTLNVPLIVAHKFLAPGAAGLRCAGGLADLSSIHIAALKAGTLQNVALP